MRRMLAIIAIVMIAAGGSVLLAAMFSPELGPSTPGFAALGPLLAGAIAYVALWLYMRRQARRRGEDPRGRRRE